MQAEDSRRKGKAEMVIMALCLIAGVAMAPDWPTRWVPPFGEFSSYLGLLVVLISAVSLIRDLLKK